MAIAVLLVAAVALSLIRVCMTDTPWHLATARLAFATGHWPVHNTFSYTFPDYPLYQQYPVYQTLLYLVYLLGKWEALSIFHCVLWVTIFCLWIWWGGSWRGAAKLNLIWVLGLLGLQQRMILRPDLITMLLFVLLLLLIDGYRRGKTWMAGLFVIVQLLMANSHQLFPLGLGVQGVLLAHLVIVRHWGGQYGISRQDERVPIWPVLLALVGSLLACLMTPLGFQILKVTAHTLGSLAHHRDEVQEFAPFYSDAYRTVLVILATGVAIAAFRHSRKSWEPFEAFLWLMGVALVLAAMRGMNFYIIICVALFARSYARQGPFLFHGVSQGSPRRRNLVGVICFLLTIEISLFVLYQRWVAPPRILGGTQPGVGLALGVWPHSAIDFIRKHPPPGKMLNIPWYAGNPLIWDLYPQHRVFVDPRFETYPRDFLIEAIRSETEQSVLDQMIEAYQPDWIVGWIADPSVRQRLASLVAGGHWALVHVDTVFLILVRDREANQAYLAANKILPGDISPPDFLKSEPDLLALQQIRMAELYRDLGLQGKAAEMIRQADPASRKYSTVRKALESFRKESSYSRPEESPQQY